MIAALFVQTGGCYFGLEGVEPWDQTRDARKYAGPHAVIAHPPCSRWGRYWMGQPGGKRLIKGDDDGCFASALASVRKWGGVLEHPRDSSAWSTFGLNRPNFGGGWTVADFTGGWTCEVEQGHYGHLARKPTWLYAVRVSLTLLTWGKSVVERRPGDSPARGMLERLSKKQRAATPIAFRDLLIAMARSVG